MEFHLLYDGPLHADTQRHHWVQEKHTIRKVFHRQITYLWKTHPFLAVRYKAMCRDPFTDSSEESIRWVDLQARNFNKCGFNFLPLVGQVFDIACSLDVLFLRRSHPGSLVSKGGDIDNRIKVLFDALRIPDQCSELPPSAKPSDRENPFFSLLQDDKLITQFKVTTDRLLTPSSSDHPENDAFLLIKVRALATGASMFNAFA
jgi:hypothetical protein